MVSPLLELLRRLKQLDYRFTAVTPLTHSRVLDRPWSGPADLRDIFGWSRPFHAADLPADLLQMLDAAAALEQSAGKLRSKLRVTSIGDNLFLHSAFPTVSPDSVFFGPDTYRFDRFLHDAIPQLRIRPGSIADMGSGSGAGGIVAAQLVPETSVALVDINPAALELAAVNAAAAGVEAQTVRSGSVPAADLIVANPPYMIDPARRAYRDGGDLLGGAVALDWTKQALANGSAMLLYTGVAFVSGQAPFLQALEQACAASRASLSIEEIDPDVFGEELEQPAYGNVERIAAIGAVIRPGA